MNNRIFLIAAVFLCLFFVPLAGLADTVLLKNGRKLESEKAWQEGDQVWLIYHGMKASIPQSKVMRIEKAGKDTVTSASLKKQSKGTKKKSEPQSAETFPPESVKQTLSTSKNPIRESRSTGKPLVLAKDGLADMKWGARVANTRGLERKKTDSRLKDVVEYTRPNDSLKLDESELESVVYAFWRDQLYTISIWTQGQENYAALRSAAFKYFGKGIRVDDPGEKYLWSDADTDIMLKYTDDGQYGLLWMRSKKIDRKFKLSNMNRQTSYLKWMKSNN